jgi:low temperature requirement protein LtrA
MVLGGPAVYLLGETLFRVRMIGSASTRRVTTIVVLCALFAIAGHLSALALCILVTLVVTALAVWEDTSRTRTGARDDR